MVGCCGAIAVVWICAAVHQLLGVNGGRCESTAFGPLLWVDRCVLAV